tara:strand:+ start:1125 stop:1610 length:486 start_codon:yes stop_codon:yes gene_type:complete
MSEYKLNNNWTLWYHSIDNNEWTNSSYQKIIDIDNLYDVKILLDNLKSNHLQNAMFFMMRDEIFPTWEYPDNREGCSISFKVPASTLKNNWDLLITNIFTGNIFKNLEDIDKLNGISISPKKEFNIIKLWLKDNEKDYDKYINEYPPYLVKNKSLYKKHIS